MTTTPKKLVGATMTTTLTTVLYTVPAATTTVITALSVCNTSASAANLTLTIDGTPMFSAAPVQPNETWPLGPDTLRHVLPTGATITGGASAATAIAVRISGAELT